MVKTANKASNVITVSHFIPCLGFIEPSLADSESAGNILALPEGCDIRKRMVQENIIALPDFSVIVPAYNEEVRLRRSIPAIAGFLTGRKWSFELIVVDDGSRDSTAAVTKEMMREYPSLRLISLNPNHGKGGAVRAGMLAAQGRYVLFTDADLSTPISEVDKLLTKLESEGFDMAIGSRGVAGAQVEQTQVWYRHLAGDIFGWGIHLLCLRGIVDTQCGFKLMTRTVAGKIFPQMTSDTAIFDVEMLVVAAREGYRIAEVPVKWVHDPDTRIPYNLGRALRIWVELFRIRRLQRIYWPIKARTT
jgi:dolichyl-phosphate beta-glucosyltransferase